MPCTGQKFCLYIRTYPNKIFRRVFGLFWPIFNSFCGGYINSSILPPQKELKIGAKELKNRQKLFIRVGSSVTSSKIYKETLY